MKDRDDDTEDMFGEDLNEASILAHLDQVSEIDVHHWPQRLVELIDVISEVLMRKHRLEANEAKHKARDIAVSIGWYFGGRQLYLPTGQEMERAVRNKAIWDAHNGRNVEELAQKYQLTVTMIYSILGQQRKLHIGRIQKSCFDPPLLNQ